MEEKEKTKKFRDPIYGYIEIEESVVHNIVDTATFQRLRNIRQTSYGPLYPAALHNRFVHSLGVYHLGCLAFDAVIESLRISEKNGTKILRELNSLVKSDIQRYKKLFKLACLLHDVGHSPFSHTGEDFYLISKSDAQYMSEDEEKKLQDAYQQKIAQAKSEDEEKKITDDYKADIKYSIHKHLAFLTHDAAFKKAKSYDAASHEIMSCIVALSEFGKNEAYFKNDKDRSFFARCITGVQYDDVIGLKQEDYLAMNDEQRDETRVKMLLNCFIQLLHSSVIDVDRLDYIIRDASTMGYQSVSIDYTRLLSGIEIVLVDDYSFTVGFHKNAISVIENAVYAHDNEKKWVQSHPAILYESFLLNQAINIIEERIKCDYPSAFATLFSYNSLTDKGSFFPGNGTKCPDMHIRYLGDADLIFLMKNQYRSKYSDEYFNRNTRRLPVWKSEAEFMDLFDEGERKSIIKYLETLLTSDKGVVDSAEITDTSIKKMGETVNQSKQDGHSNQAEFYEKKLNYATKLLDVFEKHGIKREVALLSKSFFKSNFSKETMRQLPMLFPGSDRKSRLGNVTTTLSSEQVSDGKLVYLFYYPQANRGKINVQAVSRDLLNAFKSTPS